MHEKKIFSELKEDVDLLLIYNRGGSAVDLNFFYVTGLVTGGIFEGSYAIVYPDETKVITSLLEETSAKKGDNDVYIFRTSKEREELLKKLAGEADIIGLNYSSLTLEDFEKIKKILGEKSYVNVGEAIMNARKVKDEEEIELMREAAKIASEVADIMPEFMKEGMREYELAGRLVYEMLRRGASDVAFTSIVAFGENTAEPHYTPGARKLKKGDFVLMDFGAKYRMYNSDITRTFVFGKASNEQRDIYETVLQVQEMAIKMVRDGASGAEIDSKVHEFIDSTKYKGLMTHSTGHGLGLAVHDHVGLSRNLDVPLREGMVVTVEPGIYVPGMGGVRIEDDVVVRKNGAEVLTFAKKKELIEV